MHNALQSIFTLANTNYSVFQLSDIQEILYGSSKNTVYKAAFSRDIKKNCTITAFNLLAEKLHTYLTDNNTETLDHFDEWHQKTCIAFLDELNRNLSTHKEYGKAQKCLNMALKYLYCCHDAPNLFMYNKFTYCHMALDGYTYKGTSKQLYPLSFYRDYIFDNSRKLPSWSNLTQQEYLTITTGIRNKLSDNPHGFNEYLSKCQEAGLLNGISKINRDRDLTPFEAEFFLWVICKSNKSTVTNQLF